MGGQQPADPRVSALMAQADKASRALNLEEAQARIDEAIALAEKIGDRVGVAMSFRLKGDVFTRNALSRDALIAYDRALREFEGLGNKAGVASALAGLGASHAALGDNAKAREFANRAGVLFDELGDELGRAYLWLNLRPDTPQANLRAMHVDDVIEIARRHSDDTLLGRALRSKANGLLLAGDLAGAETAYAEAAAAHERTSHLTDLATTFLEWGRVLRAHGDYEGAIRRYQKTIDLLAPTGERYTIVEATNAKAIALGFLSRHKEAIAAYERGLALAREGANQRLIEFMEGNLAGGLSNAKEYDRAIPALEAVIARRPEPSLLGYRYNSLAEALTAVNRTDEAVAPSNEAVRLARELKQTDSLRIRLDTRGSILSKLGRYEEALGDAREAMAIVEQTRARLIPLDFLKQGYGERVEKGYLAIVGLLSQLGRGSEALEVSEQGRARAFLDLLAARELKDGTLPTRGAATASGAAASAGLASESMGRPVDLSGMKLTAARLKSTVVSYWVTDEATLIWVVRPDGEPTHIRVPITREKLAGLVAGTTAPLREELTAPATRRAETAADVAARAGPEDVAAIPMRGLGVLALSRDDKAAWRQLYKSLVDPVRAHFPVRGSRITIVPHGPLFQLSFAGLQSAGGRYLVEDYELHYAPAISALEFTVRRQRDVNANATGPWAIVGNPAALPMVNGRALSPLPGAAREIAAVSALAPGGMVLRLDGSGADEAALTRALAVSHPSLLHFATHGFVFDDPKQPPFLALNRKGKTDADDGRLTLDEVYGLRLDTDLVVLSACRSGSGRVSSDGVIGLTRGFFYAGSPSVLATFWDVVDEATSSLMSGFYRRYAKARTKAPSLRSAQLALLADLRAGKVIVTAGGRRVTLPEHPLLWAAFFLSGEP
jgi:CHAT domain-containing protein/tetratricopeptide (TPR) repeat protein